MKTLFRFACLTLWFACAAQAQNFIYEGVKPQIIIDVRTPEEFAGGHIQGAVNIPYDQIGTGITSLKDLKKDGPVLVYCRSGRRSAIAKLELEKQGYRKVQDGGGMDSLSAKLEKCTAKTC